MKIGILGGTGPLGRGLALRLGAAGHHVVLGSREEERAAGAAAELRTAWPDRPLRIEGTTNASTAASDLVVMATPWDGAGATLRPLAEQLAGRVVVSVANALVKDGRELQALISSRGSVAAMVQAALPDALVAAGGHHLPAAGLADLDHELAADVLVCSDHPQATSATMDLFESIDGLRALDAGTMASAAALEAFTAVLVNVNIRYRARSTLRLGGVPPRSGGPEGRR